MVQQKHHSKPNTNQLLNYSPPLKDPLSRNRVDEVMLNVVHHTFQQLEEVLHCRIAKGESLHEVLTAAVDSLQAYNALLRYPKTREVNIRRSSTLEVCCIKVIGLGLLKMDKEGIDLTHRIGNGGRTAINLKLRGWSHLSGR